MSEHDNPREVDQPGSGWDRIRAALARSANWLTRESYEQKPEYIDNGILYIPCGRRQDGTGIAVRKTTYVDERMLDLFDGVHSLTDNADFIILSEPGKSRSGLMHHTMVTNRYELDNDGVNRTLVFSILNTKLYRNGSIDVSKIKQVETPFEAFKNTMEINGKMYAILNKDSEYCSGQFSRKMPVNMKRDQDNPSYAQLRLLLDKFGLIERNDT